jgi:hypothetical protein
MPSAKKKKAVKDSAAQDYLDQLIADLKSNPWSRLYRAMYVLTMHKGRPHAVKPAFQRRWLSEVHDMTHELLRSLPDEDTT